VFLRVGLVAVIVAGGYVGYVAIRHAQSVTLPGSTGVYAVGRTMFDWTDLTRSDPLAPQAGNPRQLSVWLWYPAPPGTHGSRARYAPGVWSRLHFPGPVGLAETNFGAVRNHALDRAPVADGRFPVVVLEPGMGLAVPQYTTIAEGLASRGYLVAGVTPTYSANLTVLHGAAVESSPTGNPRAFDNADLHVGAAQEAGDRLVQVWAADARFTARQVGDLGVAGEFAGHLDADRTAYIGHSFGGAAALQACHDDPHCVSAANLDGTQFGSVVHSGLDRPTLTMASENSCIAGVCRSGGAAERSDRDTAATLLAASTGAAFRYQITGMQHFNFTDYAAYYLAAPLRSQLALGSIDGGRGLAITVAYLAAFLDHTVHDRPEPLLTTPDPSYPQVTIL
jgi:pimeloyl-ACP methyl ester carboxylesterase